MAARRPQVGLRRGGPGLSGAPHGLAGRLALAAVLLLIPACLGLSEDEQARLTLHQENSQDFYQRGAYQQALHQADMALQMDDDLVGMRLIRGFCLVKLGKSLDDTSLLDKAVGVFDGLIDSQGDGDFRVFLGAGQAHLARALAHEREMGRIQRRLDSDFLDEAGRVEETAWLGRERDARLENLRLAEQDLRQVLADPIHGDNAYALIDLVLVLTSLGNRDDEVVASARKAVDLLEELNGLTRQTLAKSLNLSSEGKLNLERRVEENLDKERQLRDIIATVEFNRGAYQASLEQLDALEQDQLMKAPQYFNRAGIYEKLGMYPEAVADLQAFLRLRARDGDYDEVASEVFDRIDALQVLQARETADSP